MKNECMLSKHLITFIANSSAHSNHLQKRHLTFWVLTVDASPIPLFWRSSSKAEFSADLYWRKCSLYKYSVESKMKHYRNDSQYLQIHLDKLGTTCSLSFLTVRAGIGRAAIWSYDMLIQSRLFVSLAGMRFVRPQRLPNSLAGLW